MFYLPSVGSASIECGMPTMLSVPAQAHSLSDIHISFQLTPCSMSSLATSTCLNFAANCKGLNRVNGLVAMAGRAGLGFAPAASSSSTTSRWPAGAVNNTTELSQDVVIVDALLDIAAGNAARQQRFWRRLLPTAAPAKGK